MKLLIIGAGYVGVVTAACFAEMGHEVICLDNNPKVIESLKRLEIHIYEPNLYELIKSNVQGKRLKFTSDVQSAIGSVNICFIAVGSPPLTTGHADLRPVINSSREIGKYLKGKMLVVNKSTVPAGTTKLIAQEIEAVLKERDVDFNVKVVSNPEFLCEGSAIQHFFNPSRVIIGTNDEEAIKTLKKVYAPLNLDQSRLIIMDPTSAEITKYASNAMLALRISFINEIASLCEAIGADVSKVRQGIGLDNRIGSSYIYAGPGFGGSCFPKDLSALIGQFEEYHLPCYITEATCKVNYYQKQLISNKIIDYFKNKNDLSALTIGVLGLSFKPETDDIRESPAIALVKQLFEHQISLRLYDPKATKKARLEIDGDHKITWCNDAYSCAKEADAIVLMTEWKEFIHLDFTHLYSIMSQHVFFDARNQFDPNTIAEQGFDYISIGRPTAYARIKEGTGG